MIQIEQLLLLVKYEDEYRYIIAPQRLSVGDKILSGPNSDIKPGNALPMTKIPMVQYSQY